MGRSYLDVPYAEKDAAKALGARWDPTARRWYDPRPPSPGLDRWTARPEVPELLPGEDRTFGSGLFVDPGRDAASHRTSASSFGAATHGSGVRSGGRRCRPDERRRR